jgi:hypothetical protein
MTIRQKSRTRTIANTGENVELQKLSLLIRTQNTTVTLEDSLEVSSKTKHSKYTPWFLLKGVENLCPHKKLHMDVLCITVKMWKQSRRW